MRLNKVLEFVFNGMANASLGLMVICSFFASGIEQKILGIAFFAAISAMTKMATHLIWHKINDR